MSQAVFIIGWGRSGTTWLSNLLQQHPDISAVTESDKGIIESVYFSEMVGRYGDLSESTNFIELAAVLAQSYYFQQAGGNLDSLLARYPVDYVELFRGVMDDFAKAKGCPVWIEKTPAHTLLAEDIAQSIPDALFIAIERDVQAVVRSRLGMFEVMKRDGLEKAGKLRMAIKIAEWVLTRQHYVNCTERLRRKLPDRVLSIRYEDLQSHTEIEIKRICNFLSLEFDPSSLESHFRSNSSFTRGISEDELPSWALGSWLRIWQGLAKFIPGFLLSAAHRAGVILKFGKGRQHLPHFFFGKLEGAPQQIKKMKW